MPFWNYIFCPWLLQKKRLNMLNVSFILFLLLLYDNNRCRHTHFPLIAGVLLCGLDEIAAAVKILIVLLQCHVSVLNEYMRDVRLCSSTVSRDKENIEYKTYSNSDLPLCFPYTCTAPHSCTLLPFWLPHRVPQSVFLQLLGIIMTDAASLIMSPHLYQHYTMMKCVTLCLVTDWLYLWFWCYGDTWSKKYIKKIYIFL